MYRTPSVTSTAFGDVSLFFYMNQGRTPAGSTRGHLMDHYAVSVADLDAWLAKLRAETRHDPRSAVPARRDLRAMHDRGPEPRSH